MIVRSVSAMCLLRMRKKKRWESVSLSAELGMCPPYIVRLESGLNPGKVGIKNPPALIPECQMGKGSASS